MQLQVACGDPGVKRMETSDRKLQRIQNKVNKLKAFYALTQGKALEATFTEQRDESSPDSGIDIGEPDPKPNNILPPDELALLRKRLGKQQTEKLSRPVLFQIRAPDLLQTANVRQLLLYALVGGDAPGLKPEWCTLIRWQKVSQIVVVAVDGMTKGDWEDYASLVSPTLQKFLPIGGKLEPQREGCLTRNILESPVNRGMKKIDRFINGRFHIEGSLLGDYVPPLPVPAPTLSTGLLGDARFHLLMSIERMAMEKYPIPHCSIGGVDTPHYLPTKDMYQPVSGSSQLFAVDCEMCMTSPRRHELTRISIVNEHLDVVYDTYVKPFNPILNYLTKYSGITKAIMDPVKTRLHDVQAAVRKLLPPDAILCGQSLNGDLHALEMTHPYVIDTSVIYNLSGSVRGKSSLKILSQLFLGKSIQGPDKTGHDSVEDSRTTMELVLMKLKHGIAFGDVTRGWEIPVQKAIDETPVLPATVPVGGPVLPVIPVPVPDVQANVKFPLKRMLEDMEATPVERGPAAPAPMFVDQKRSVLGCATGRESKKACIVGTTEFVETLREMERLTVNCSPSMKRTMKRALEHLPSHDFVHVDLSLGRQAEDRNTQISSLMKGVLKLFAAAQDRALCMVVLSGDDTGNKLGLEFGLCYATVKDSGHCNLERLAEGPAPDPD